MKASSSINFIIPEKKYATKYNSNSDHDDIDIYSLTQLHSMPCSYLILKFIFSFTNTYTRYRNQFNRKSFKGSKKNRFEENFEI